MEANLFRNTMVSEMEPKIDWKSMQVTIKNQLFKIRKGLVGAKNVGTFARKNQTNCDEFATLEFILSKYREYNDVFEKPEKGFPLPKHSENNHEIVLETPGKFATGFIYNTKKNESFSDLNIKTSQKKLHQIFEIKNNPTHHVRPIKNRELKMCVDYKKINTVTVKNKYPLPLMTDMKTKFKDARYFKILNLRDVFNFIRIKQKNEWKTAFRTKYGTYEYLVMPLGLTNVLTTMQKVVNKILQSYLDRFAIIYMDDILVY